mgnify:CR=1 FL=1
MVGESLKLHFLIESCELTVCFCHHLNIYLKYFQIHLNYQENFC